MLSMSGGNKKKAPQPAPQLAREVINLESSSDEDVTSRKKPKIQQLQNNNNAVALDDGGAAAANGSDSDDSSLMIMPPVKKKVVNRHFSQKNHLLNKPTNMKNKAASFKKPPPPAASASSTTNKKSAAVASRFSKDYEFSDSDDDSDDDLLLSTKPTFETREQINDRKKREKERQKEREKLEKAKKRQEAKEAREQHKLREKEEKHHQNQTHAQAIGKFKHDEIAVLMDPKLIEDDPLGLVEKLSDDFLIHSYPSKKISSVCAAIQFVRKDYLRGGAKAAVASLEENDKQGYEHIHQLVLVIGPGVFIPLLQRDNNDIDDDFPKLEAWLSSIKSKWRKVWKKASHEEPRLFLMLKDLPKALDRMWKDYRRQHRGEPCLPRVLELEDAMQWLLVQFQVECMLCPNANLIQLTLHKMTRALSDKPYATQVTELECIKKIKAGPGAASDDAVHRASDVWLRQLQQIPRLSEPMAENVVQQYPTCQSLWQKYQELLDNEDVDEGIEDCSSLLANILNAGRNSQQKLSQAVFRIMTSDDPNEMIL
ncbi:MAG: hypothetical protein SGILL_003365 [Bacillariaceae sp.]